MREVKQYEPEYKVQAVKLAKEVGPVKAAKELGISKNTLYGWIKAAKEGAIDADPGYRTPEESLNLTDELKSLCNKVKEQEKEIKRLNELNEFLEEASAFFAASRQRSRKTKG